MRTAIILFASIGLTVNVQAENLIRAMLNSFKKKEDVSKKYKGVEKVSVGDSPFYYYRLERTDSENIEATKPGSPPVTKYVPSVESHPDVKPIERVIDKYQVLDEVSTSAVKDGRRVAYGNDSPLRDDKVIEAWKEAEAAQRRLDEHRSYMERLRQNRKRIENSKRVTSGINQTAGDDQ